MTTNSYGEPAKIYQFPVRGRFKGAVRRDESASAPKLASPRIPEVAFGSGWYHEAAIREERARNDRSI
jgi:hypothetical protein